MARPLVIFDIDGTLTEGDGLGTACYFSAFQEEFQFRPHSFELTAFSESTDLGIAAEIFEKAWGRAGSEGEVERLRSRYVGSLTEALNANPTRCYRARPGAAAALGGGLSQAGWGVSLATGNFRAAAHLKLASAGLAIPEGGGFGEDGLSRSLVLETALLTWLREHQLDEVSAVYVGDRPWDAQAAHRVGIGFVAVSSAAFGEGREERDHPVLEDLAAADDLLAALAREAATYRR